MEFFIKGLTGQKVSIALRKCGRIEESWKSWYSKPAFQCVSTSRHHVLVIYMFIVFSDFLNRSLIDKICKERGKVRVKWCFKFILYAERMLMPSAPTFSLTSGVATLVRLGYYDTSCGAAWSPTSDSPFLQQGIHCEH